MYTNAKEQAGRTGLGYRAEISNLAVDTITMVGQQASKQDWDLGFRIYWSEGFRGFTLVRLFLISHLLSVSGCFAMCMVILKV